MNLKSRAKTKTKNKRRFNRFQRWTFLCSHCNKVTCWKGQKQATFQSCSTMRFLYSHRYDVWYFLLHIRHCLFNCQNFCQRNVYALFISLLNVIFIWFVYKTNTPLHCCIQHSNDAFAVLLNMKGWITWGEP